MLTLIVVDLLSFCCATSRHTVSCYVKVPYVELLRVARQHIGLRSRARTGRRIGVLLAARRPAAAGCGGAANAARPTLAPRGILGQIGK